MSITTPNLATPAAAPTERQGRYYALKTMTVEDHQVFPGQHVPEADAWPDTSTWIDSGHLIFLPIASDLSELMMEVEGLGRLVGELADKVKTLTETAHTHQKKG